MMLESIGLDFNILLNTTKLRNEEKGEEQQHTNARSVVVLVFGILQNVKELMVGALERRSKPAR
jgi:hypothetical protein